MMLSNSSLEYIWETLLDAPISVPQTDHEKQMRKTALLEMAEIIAAKNKIKNKASPSPQDLKLDTKYLFRFTYPAQKKVDVIKWVRNVTPMSLKDAKDLVESEGLQCKFSMELLSNVFLGFVLPEGVTWVVLPAVEFPEIYDAIQRQCYLVFSKDSKTVKLYADEPDGAIDGVGVMVTVNIPKSLFDKVKLRAKFNLPCEALSQDAIVDLEQALGMSYGQKIQLIVEGAHAEGVATDSG